MNKIPLTIVCEGGWAPQVLHVVAPPSVGGVPFRDLIGTPFYFDPKTNDWTGEESSGVHRVSNVTKGHIEILYAACGKEGCLLC